MNTSGIKTYSLGYADIKTYLFASLFIIGNLVLPQLFHLVPQGGLIFLPIYFFTLIAVCKYGMCVGLLTAILSPIANHLLFEMPASGVLPIILIKSMLLVFASVIVYERMKKVSILSLMLIVFAYQITGTLIEWAIVGDFYTAVQDFRLGIPGMLLQIFGGYGLLKLMANK